MSELTGFGIFDVFTHRVFEELKQFSTGTNGGDIHSLDTSFQISRDRFVGAHAQNRVRISCAFAHHQSDVRKLVVLSQNQPLDFFGNGSNLDFTIGALEKLDVAQVV